MKAALQSKIDLKTKPLGALGILEQIALQIGSVQNSLTPTLNKPTIITFAADHGIANDGVSAYPQEVTYQMVMNFLQGGAAINVFCEQHQIEHKIVDAGVNYNFEAFPEVINAKMDYGTKSFRNEKAMTFEQVSSCFEKSKKIVDKIADDGCNIIGFGEMGIGNTSAATMMMSSILDLTIINCIGRGTGVDDKGYAKKFAILEEAKAFHGNITDPMEVLVTYGGFEIAQMCGAMIAAYERGMLIMVDGFIASAAFLVVYKLYPEIKDYAIFCHQSDESGHERILNYLQVTPLLKLGMRVGEGTGCAVAYPIIKSAITFLNLMSSFEAAGVANKN